MKLLITILTLSTLANATGKAHFTLRETKPVSSGIVMLTPMVTPSFYAQQIAGPRTADGVLLRCEVETKQIGEKADGSPISEIQLVCGEGRRFKLGSVVLTESGN